MRPHEVIVFPAVEVTHRPPEAGLERGSDQDGIVATANVVLVLGEGSSRERYVVIVRFVHFHKEGAIVSFLQFKVLLFVLRVSQIFRQSLNLSKQTFEAIIDRFGFFLSEVIFPLSFLQQRSLSAHRHTACLTEYPTVTAGLSTPRHRWLLTYRLLLSILGSSQEDLIVHPSLDDQQRCCDE